jgi:hypothetical protein
MDWLKILQEIFTVCIIPLIGILTKYLISYIEIKKESIKESNNSELAKKYVDLLAQTIETCVIATNQTYVESLKKKNAFTPEAQREAFKMTKDAVLSILSSEAEKYLTQIYGDLNIYIENQIQASVNANKMIMN